MQNNDGINYFQLTERFSDIFDREDSNLRVFFAPGRVNLIGEHTDYNGGYVFPAALSYGTWAFASPREDGIFRFASTNFSGLVEVGKGEIVYKKEDGWGNYPKGVLQQLSRYTELKGADILFHGNVPNRSGLSSSASIELVTALSITTLAKLELPMLELVKLAQRAENQFVGVNCGIMDQFASGMGRKDHAMLLKADTFVFEYVPIQLANYSLVITNTNKERGLTDSKYNVRRQECESGLALIKSHYPMISSLGDLSYAEWQEINSVVQKHDQVIYNRLEHVISENERVLLAKHSLEKNDLATFGELMKQSHISLRDLYEVTGKELDSLYNIAAEFKGCLGTRMTGAGFGGCTVSLVAQEDVPDFKELVKKNYYAETGLVPSFYVCDIGDGAKEITEEAPSEHNDHIST